MFTKTYINSLISPSRFFPNIWNNSTNTHKPLLVNKASQMDTDHGIEKETIPSYLSTDITKPSFIKVKYVQLDPLSKLSYPSSMGVLLKNFYSFYMNSIMQNKS